MSYSTKVLDHYENPRNVGSFDKSDESVGTGMVGAPACGDVMKLQIKVNEAGVIEDARFKTYGCVFGHRVQLARDRMGQGQDVGPSHEHPQHADCRRAGLAAGEGALFHPGRRRNQGCGAELQRKALGAG
jgi:hypothetical protein